LEKLLGNISCKESAFATENSNSFTSKGEVITKELERGSYLFEMSGYFVCSTAGITKHDVIFILEFDGQKIAMETCLHTNGGYGYLYSLRK